MYNVYIVGDITSGVTVRTFELQHEAIAFADLLINVIADEINNGSIGIGIEDEYGDLIEW